ncbi:MAG TPA: hypothetical protein VGC95_04755 [Chitinophagaceae bacterium]
MKDKDIDTPFPWTLAFFTTSICFFGFFRFMKFLTISLPSAFVWIAAGSLGMGIISAIVSVLAKSKRLAGQRPSSSVQ